MFVFDPGIFRAINAVRNSPISAGRGIVFATESSSQVVKPAPNDSGFAEYVVIHIQKKHQTFTEAGGWKEVGLAGINCTAAVVAALFTFGSASTTIFSAGASTPLTYAGYAATAATGVACANGVARTYNAAVSPATNAQWDASKNYQTTMSVIDGVSLLGIGATAVSSVKILGLLKRAGVSLKSGSKTLASGVNSKSRKRLARSLTENTRGPLSGQKYKELVRSGAVQSKVGANQIDAGIVKMLMDNVAAGLSFAGSVFDGNIHQFSLYVIGIEE